MKLPSPGFAMKLPRRWLDLLKRGFSIAIRRINSAPISSHTGRTRATPFRCAVASMISRACRKGHFMPVAVVKSYDFGKTSQ